MISMINMINTLFILKIYIFYIHTLQQSFGALILNTNKNHFLAACEKVFVTSE
jgi:hypothetical protein